MMTILAMVNADKEGQIESKMMKARQMEEIREARRVEGEKKADERKKRLEETKEGLRKKRRRSAGDAAEAKDEERQKASKPLKLKKRVSFA
jgi:60S ribosomal subunit assembly/export protein LOC1